MSRPRTEALDQLLRLTQLLDSDMERELTARGLTRARTHVLWVLGGKEGCTQRELAAGVGVTPRTMTGLVDALEATGFVRRAAHPTDRRATLVTLTARGREAFDWLVSSHVDLAQRLFGSLPARRYDALLRELRDVSERLATAIAEAADDDDRRAVAGG